VCWCGQVVCHPFPMCSGRFCPRSFGVACCGVGGVDSPLPDAAGSNAMSQSTTADSGLTRSPSTVLEESLLDLPSSARDNSLTTLGQARAVSFPPRSVSNSACVVYASNKKRRTDVVESQPTQFTTTIGQCGGEPDPLDYVDDTTTTITSTTFLPPKRNVTSGMDKVHIAFGYGEDLPGDEEEETAINWAMAASTADALLRNGNQMQGATTTTTTTNTLPSGLLPSGMGGYSAGRRGSEEHTPQALKKVKPALVVALQTDMSERSCLSSLQTPLSERRIIASPLQTSSSERLYNCSPSHVLRGGDDPQDGHNCRKIAEVQEQVEQHGLQSTFKAKRARLQETLSSPEAVFFSPSASVHKSERSVYVERLELQSNIQGVVRVLSTPPPPPPRCATAPS